MVKPPHQYISGTAAYVIVYLVLFPLQVAFGLWLAKTVGYDLSWLIVIAISLYPTFLVLRIYTWKASGRPAFPDPEHRTAAIIVMVVGMVIYIFGLVGIVQGFIAGKGDPVVILVPWPPYLNNVAWGYVIAIIILYVLPDSVVYGVLIIRGIKRRRRERKALKEYYKKFGRYPEIEKRQKRR